jgi:hypothetical protein
MNIPKIDLPKSIPVPTDGALFVGGGAAAGAGAQLAIGGAGLAAMGTAVAVPMVFTGAGAGLLLYGAYRLGRKLRGWPMATKFFIGGNEFYDDEEEAEHALEAFRIRYGVPEDAFVVVQIDQEEKKIPALQLPKEALLH